MTSSKNPSSVGATVTFTASVTGVAPTGSVGFSDGGTTISGCGAVALTGSGNTRTAACSTSALSTGSHTIGASYVGDAGNTGSQGNLTQTVQSASAPTTTTLTSSANPSAAGTTITFTAAVNGTAPTGSVGFADGGTTLSGCTAVALTGSGNTRIAACSSNALTVGAHSITRQLRRRRRQPSVVVNGVEPNRDQRGADWNGYRGGQPLWRPGRCRVGRSWAPR